MSFKLRFTLLAAILVLGSGLEARSEAAGPAVDEVLARFEQGDPGWKVRMESLVELARAGPEATAPLIEALRSESPGVREFAAQALAFQDDPEARPALERALADVDELAPVRIYALKALRMLGALEPAEKYAVFTDDADRGVRGTMAGALERTERLSGAAMREVLAQYDLAQLDIAEVGQLAPDFELESFSGERIRLSGFRGKQAVVLRYFKLDY